MLGIYRVFHILNAVCGHIQVPWHGFDTFKLQNSKILIIFCDNVVEFSGFGRCVILHHFQLMFCSGTVVPSSSITLLFIKEIMGSTIGLLICLISSSHRKCVRLIDLRYSSRTEILTLDSISVTLGGLNCS